MSESVWTRVIPAARPPLWQGQIFAVFVVAVGFLLRWAISPLIGSDELPFLTFFPAVLIATTLAGRWAGFTALVASALAGIWAFASPRSGFDLTNFRVAWAFGAFMLSGGVVWFTAVVLRSTVLALREQQAALQVEAAERERTGERLRTVAQELEHRVRNLLTLIQGLVLQSARGADSVDGYQKALGERLQALAKAQHLLVDAGASALPLPRILEEAVRPFDADGRRFRLEGPEIMAPADVALPLALALHELSTNAVKYGALSSDEGRIDLSWSCDGAEVALEWKEHDGPPVKAPERRGFGSRLLESALSAHHGRCEIAFEPDGVRYHATFEAGRT